jgi:lysosomal acid lipase/cholesteryl ester hydrolase
MLTSMLAFVPGLELVLRLLILLCVGTFVSVAHFVLRLITFFYSWCPFPWLLDKAFKRSGALQRYFSYQLDSSKQTAAELIKSNGYGCEEYLVKTADGYVLCMQRILPRQPNQCKHTERPPVLLVHGLMMCSDIWLLLGAESLAFLLVEEGFDVFLGNVRGNRYSCKHEHLSPESNEFWDFSLDELALYDIPAMVDFIRRTTNFNKIGYLGFSQGTALAMCSFARYPALADRIAFFGALAPAGCVNGMSDTIVNALLDLNSSIIFAIFGRRMMVGSTTMWQRILSPSFLAKAMDVSMGFLFNWTNANIDEALKPKLYAHLYSYSSCKVVQHWLQITKSQKLQMYDDIPSWSHTQPLSYDIGRIRCPIGLFYGLRDGLINPEGLISQLPAANLVHVHTEETYEHLDFLWAKTAPKTLFPAVIRVLKQYLDDNEFDTGSVVSANTPQKATDSPQPPRHSADFTDSSASAGMLPPSSPSATLLPESPSDGDALPLGTPTPRDRKQAREVGTMFMRGYGRGK